MIRLDDISKTFTRAGLDQARRQRIGAAAAHPVASVRCAKGL
jgi:hypothetical protein